MEINVVFEKQRLKFCVQSADMYLYFINPVTLDMDPAAAYSSLSAGLNLYSGDILDRLYPERWTNAVWLTSWGILK